MRLLLPALFGCLSLFLSPAGASEPQPHIVFILVDDLGYGDLPAYNPDSRIETPHLDRLAAAGMTFTDAHSGGSTCIPSRYSLHSGEFSVRAPHLRDRQGPVLPEGQPTIASLLRDQGYQTTMVGKWHLGFDQKGSPLPEGVRGYSFDYNQPLTGGPMDRGFDAFFGMHASLDIPPYFYIQGRLLTRKPTHTVEDSSSEGGPEGWNRIQGAFWRGGDIASDFKHIEVTPRFAEEASKVIETHNTEQPLFLYLALPSPHTPWLPTEEFQGKSKAGMYGDFVMQVDAVVGQVMASLDKAGMADDTLLIFTSDNGPVWYEKDEEKFGHRATGPLRGAKGSVWEGGHRVPFLASWPGRIQAGSRNARTLAFADVFATFAELTQAGTIDKTVARDSVSFLGSMLGTEEGSARGLPLLHGERTVRDGDWKLIATKGSRGFNAEKGVNYGIELYNLAEDVAEENNLAESMPEKVEALREVIQSELAR